MFGVILLTTIFSLIFSLVFYGVGYYGGYSFIERHNNSKSVILLKRIYHKYNKRALFIARLIPFSRTYVSIFSGALRQNFYSYIICSFFGIFIWNSLYVYLGLSLYLQFFI